MVERLQKASVDQLLACVVLCHTSTARTNANYNYLINELTSTEKGYKFRISVTRGHDGTVDDQDEGRQKKQRFLMSFQGKTESLRENCVMDATPQGTAPN